MQRARPRPDPAIPQVAIPMLMYPHNVDKLAGRPFEFGRHTLIFVHIPKCGGTSLHRTLEEIDGLRYRHLRGTPADLDGIEQLGGIGGHQNFGSTPLHRDRDHLVYITVIRSPRDRIGSFYRHVRDHPEHHLRAQIPGIHEMGPVEFVETLAAAGNYEISDLQTKMLTGRSDISAEDAIAHVEAMFSVVGLLGEPASYLAPLQRLFPRGPVNTHVLNVGRTTEADIPQMAAFDALVDETNSRDKALHAHFAAAWQRANESLSAG